jgi:serine protease SohB
MPGDDPHRKKSLFVMRFPGDIRASQVNELREEVTAVVRAAKVGDEALLVLESGEER